MILLFLILYTYWRIRRLKDPSLAYIEPRTGEKVRIKDARTGAMRDMDVRDVLDWELADHFKWAKRLLWLMLGTVVLYSACDASPVFQSEIGNELCARHGCPAIVWYSRPEAGAALAQVSLRSTDAMADVSEVATRWGGGGHRNAAGAVVPLGVWLAFVGRMVAMEGVS